MRSYSLDPAGSSQASLVRLLQQQGGVLARAQAREHGISDDRIAGLLRVRRWQRIHPGVYCTFTGPLPPLARVWAALLYAGPGAAVSHETAAWLEGCTGDLGPLVHITVPENRRVVPQPGLEVHRTRWCAERTHPVRQPPRIRVEDTVLDLVNRASSADQVVDVVTRACQRRRTSAPRIDAAARARGKLRWRGLLADLLVDVASGAHSPLEVRYLRDVERAHGLPRARRQAPDRCGARSRWRDVL